MEPLKIFTSTPLDCKKAHSLSVRIHPFIDRIGYLLHGIIHLQKSWGGGLQPVVAWLFLAGGVDRLMVPSSTSGGLCISSRVHSHQGYYG